MLVWFFMENYVTINKFAKIVGLTTPSIIGHIDRGNIRTVYRKIRAIPESEIERFLSVKKDKNGKRQIAGRFSTD